MKVFEGLLSAENIRFGIVASRFNSIMVDRLVEGAIDCIVRHKGKKENITLLKVPGAWEIPLACKKLAKREDIDCVIALGVIIRGATPHFEYIASESSKGIALASLETEKPITFGIITADSLEQAIERAGSKAGNKGYEAALSAIEMVNLFKAL